MSCGFLTMAATAGGRPTVVATPVTLEVLVLVTMTAEVNVVCGRTCFCFGRSAPAGETGGLFRPRQQPDVHDLADRAGPRTVPMVALRWSADLGPAGHVAPGPLLAWSGSARRRSEDRSWYGTEVTMTPG